jgi:hypothetical protein
MLHGNDIFIRTPSFDLVSILKNVQIC